MLMLRLMLLLMKGWINFCFYFVNIFLFWLYFCARNVCYSVVFIDLKLFRAFLFQETSVKVIIKYLISLLFTMGFVQEFDDWLKVRANEECVSFILFTIPKIYRISIYYTAI